MKKKIKDTDYLYSSGRVKALEKSFLPRSVLLRLTECSSVTAAIALLCEFSYFTPDCNTENIETEFSKILLNLYCQAQQLLPDRRLADFFRVKYDYHNIKIILKGIATNEEYTGLLSSCGRVASQTLVGALLEDKFYSLPANLAKAATEAKALLVRSADPQLMDGYLDKEQFFDMKQIADSVGVEYLCDYIRLQIDMQNLRAAVRLARMGADFGELRRYFIAGGLVDIGRFMAEITPELIQNNFTSGYFVTVTPVAAAALRRETGLAELDKAVDDAFMAFLKQGKLIAFGAPVPISYVCAKENELVVLRTILSGIKAGQKPEILVERLRDTYV